MQSPDPAPVEIGKRRLPRGVGIRSEKLGMLVYRVKRASSTGGRNNGGPTGKALRRKQRYGHLKARLNSKNIKSDKK